MIKNIITRVKQAPGQTLPLFALALVGLLGFAALAIDGGMLLAERRNAQNVADNAAMTGALLFAEYTVSDLSDASFRNGVYTEASGFSFARADANGYDNNGVDNTVSVNLYGPNVIPGYTYYIYEVEIVSEVPTSFTHLVFDGPLQQTTSSAVRILPKQSFWMGFGMVGLNEDSCKSIWFHGNQEVNITGCGVFSNSDATKADDSCDSLDADGAAGGVTVTPPDKIEAVGDCTDNPIVSPACESVDEQVPKFIIPPPNCTRDPADTTYEDVKLTGSDVVTLTPGNYGEITVNSGSLTLDPGLYCINDPKGFSATGGTITGTGVTLYIIDGDFDLSGGDVFLSAPSDLVDASFQQWRGMLLYMDFDNDSQVVISGNANSTYTGTIYAPGPDPEPKCKIGGTAEGDLNASSQLICDTVQAFGNTTINIDCDADDFYNFPPILDLAE